MPNERRKPETNDRAAGVACPPICNEPLGSPGMLILKPGTLDDAGWARPVGNIRTDSALRWLAIDWSQPHFPGQPAHRRPLFDARAAEIANGGSRLGSGRALRPAPRTRG